MIAEIIAVGNELLIEESLNQDYKVLVRQLAPLGIAIKARLWRATALPVCAARWLRLLAEAT